MSVQPEFILPLTEPPKKPDPVAGLGDFLQSKLGDSVKNLKSVDDLNDLAIYLQSHPNSIVWLDLEIDPKTDLLIDGAILLEEYYWHFDSKIFEQNFSQIFKFLNQARYLGGHNLIEFDLPRLVDLLIKALAKSSLNGFLIETLSNETLPN